MVLLIEGKHQEVAYSLTSIVKTLRFSHYDNNYYPQINRRLAGSKIAPKR